MSHNTDYFLTIDNGTQSIRALVFDQHGSLVAKTKIDIEPYLAPQPNWAEQDANYFWDSLCEACQQLWPLLPFDKSLIKAVSITTQRATMVALDKSGEPLRPAFVWLDQRQASGQPKLNIIEALATKIAGAKILLQDFYRQSKSNWMAEHQPDLWTKVDKFFITIGLSHFQNDG